MDAARAAWSDGRVTRGRLMYTTLMLLERCGAREELAGYATRLRATGRWTGDRLLDALTPAPAAP